MSYPGNASLSSAVKDRVRTTFNQTVALYRQGRTEEVLAGCNLILQMDPQFEPARKLLEKTQNPDAPIDVDSLSPPDTRSLIRQASDAMAARDFQTVIHVTTQILTDDLMNDEARILADEAREKMEAAPFVEQFVRKCDANLSAGNIAGARQDLEKARSLDPTHPEIIRIAFAIEKQHAASQPASFSFDATPFVVEAKPAPAGGRSAAQAADFGFTFEEEKSPAAPAAQNDGGFANFSFDSGPSAAEPFGGFSFDSPAAPAASAPTPAPAASAPSFDFGAPKSQGTNDFDFSMASVETSPDDQRKIDQYLTEGDRAFDNGDYQQAIDFWSRIFLIDVTNEAASDRIERAKGRRREIEQKVEAILSNGIQAYDRKDLDTARARFDEVLFLDPNNNTAQEYLDRLDTPAEPIAIPGVPPPPVPPPDDDAGFGFLDEPMGGSYAPPLMPPDDSQEPAAAPRSGRKSAAAKAAPAPKTGKPKGIPVPVLGAVLLVLLAAGGWFAWTTFSGGDDDAAVSTAGNSDALFNRASLLAQSGKFDEAIATLQKVLPDDPQHDRALEMIADLQQKKGSAAAMIDGRPAAQYFEEQLAAGRTAFAAHDYLAAKAAFEGAMRVKPLPPDVKASYDTASQQVAKLDSAKSLFAGRKYADAITNLQALAQQDPENKNIQRMIVDAHFNLGATALQDERLSDAVKEFDEVLKLDPNDELAKRSKDLAQRYNGEPKDLLYRIYVKYLPLRQTT
ncbi:MAG TPA: tetratricopeptide repeat protein [Thermoanaerobaculia bacterium]